jgi:hypothetical protein
MTAKEIADVATKTADYHGKVDQTRTEVSQTVPLPKYSDLNWVDLVHPVTVAAAAVLVANGVLRIFAPSGAYNAVQRMITWPVRWPTKKLLNATSYVKDCLVQYGGKNGA